MLTALPPKAVTAIEDDRPIVVGRVAEPDYYVLAHEWLNRGYVHQAHVLLTMAAIQLGLRTVEGMSSEDYWDLNIEAIDEAWGKAQGGHGN